MAEGSVDVSDSELATLQRIALDGGLIGETKLSCAGLAAQLGASTQTASRRLQRLDAAGLIDRETVSDGQWVAITEAGERALRREYQAYRRIFESPREVTLRGRVTSGMGEGRHYISLPGYQTQFEERLGYAPFPGTLNIELDPESVRARTGLAAFDPVPIDGWEDDDRTYGPAVCYPAILETGPGDRYEGAHVIAPERTHHDEDQLELIASEKLRDVLNLGDDDPVVVRVGELA